MIRIQQGQPAKVVVTLEEKRTTPGSASLFVFRHIQLRKEFRILVYDGNNLSKFRERYDEFVLDSALLPAGQYSYTVLELLQFNPDAVASMPIAGLLELESGLAEVLSSDSLTLKQYTPETEIKVYEG